MNPLLKPLCPRVVKLLYSGDYVWEKNFEDKKIEAVLATNQFVVISKAFKEQNLAVKQLLQFRRFHSNRFFGSYPYGELHIRAKIEDVICVLAKFNFVKSLRQSKLEDRDVFEVSLTDTHAKLCIALSKNEHERIVFDEHIDLTYLV